MVSRIDSLWRRARRRRWPVIANRCASSRTRWISCSAGDSGGQQLAARHRRGHAASPGPGGGPAPLATPTSGSARSRARRAPAARRAAAPAPPSISSMSGSGNSPAPMRAPCRASAWSQRRVVVARRDALDVVAAVCLRLSGPPARTRRKRPPCPRPPVWLMSKHSMRSRRCGRPSSRAELRQQRHALAAGSRPHAQRVLGIAPRDRASARRSPRAAAQLATGGRCASTSASATAIGVGQRRSMTISAGDCLLARSAAAGTRPSASFGPVAPLRLERNSSCRGSWPSRTSSTRSRTAPGSPSQRDDVDVARSRRVDDLLRLHLRPGPRAGRAAAPRARTRARCRLLHALPSSACQLGAAAFEHHAPPRRTSRA